MTFEPHLHWSFNGEHILLPFLTLNTLGSFLAASCIVVAVCLFERLFSLLLDKNWVPRSLRYSRVSIALWRTGLYSFATFLRLCYMLIAMTCHLGLISMIVISLSFVQFFVELRKLPKSPLSLSRHAHATHHNSDMQPLLEEENTRGYPLKSVQTRPRSKSKPDAIFIHPTESNLARADAAALELGIAGDTELVKGHSYVKEEPAWEIGKGKDLARQMLMDTKRKSPPKHEPFFIGRDDSDSD